MKKPSFFSRLQIKGDGWSPLHPLGTSKEVSKSKRNGADLAKSDRKVFPSHWGLHDKKHGKVCPQLRPIFPASTVLRYRGQHCGSNPLQSRGNGPIIYLQILLLLFLPPLQKFYFYYDQSVQLQISIYFQFYHNLITLKHTLLLLILFFIFRFKNFFQNFFFHELPSTLYNQNLYRAGNFHLTTKGNEILVRWFSHCLTISTSTMQLRTKLTGMPSSLRDVPPTFVIADTDCPPPPPHLPYHNSPTQLFLLHGDTANKALLLHVHVHLTVPSQVLIPF